LLVATAIESLGCLFKDVNSTEVAELNIPFAAIAPPETRLHGPVPSAQLSRLHPAHGLLQDGSDLIFAESALSHDSSSSPGEPS
jgi:hypothetical protein